MTTIHNSPSRPHFTGSHRAPLGGCGPAPRGCSDAPRPRGSAGWEGRGSEPGFQGSFYCDEVSDGAPLHQGFPACARVNDERGLAGWPAKPLRGGPPWGQITNAGPGTANRDGQTGVQESKAELCSVRYGRLVPASCCSHRHCPGLWVSARLGSQSPTARVCFRNSHGRKFLSPSGAPRCSSLGKTGVP